MALICSLFLAFLLLILVSYFTRGTSIRRIRVLGDQTQLPDARSAAFQKHLSLMTGTRLTGGNEIQVWLNGDETFARLWQDLGAARKVICLHVFVMRPGEVARRLLQVLSERSQAGVQVYVLLDAFGARSLGNDYRRLQAAGASVAVYRPLSWRTLYKYQQRLHMRAVVIDGRVGFTGGFGIADQWLGDGCHLGQWRDTNARVTGPVVTDLFIAFSTNWAEATGDLLMGDTVIPPEEAPRMSQPQAAGIITCHPSLGATDAERFFFLAIASARQRIFVTNAYFVPTRDLCRLLMNAADRGVDVRVLTPGANTNQPAAWHASRALYAELIKAGVRIFEYRPAMMHARTFVADSCLVTIGTFNFDNRSMKLNDEVALVARDQRLAETLESIFLDDLEQATEIRLDDTRLSVPDRMKASLARLGSPIL